MKYTVFFASLGDLLSSDSDSIGLSLIDDAI